MKRLMKTLFAKAVASAMLAGLAAAPVAANELPVLRSQVLTLSDIVTVGDFYTNAGLAASKPLFRSPDMGTSGNVPAEQVAERARAAGLQFAGTDGLRTVVVHRAAAKFERDQIEDLVRNALMSRNAGLTAANLEIEFQRAPNRILADPKVSDPIRVDRTEWSQASGRFTIHVTVAVENGTETIVLAGTALEMVEISALAQPLRRGDILKEADLIRLRMPRRKVPAGAVMDASDVIGKEARANLRASAPLSRKDFQRPILIKRNEKVTVTFEMPGMKLTSRAQAMVEGAKGDVIDVMNLQSRRIVPATIISRGQVRVHAANPVVASLNSEAK